MLIFWLQIDAGTLINIIYLSKFGLFVTKKFYRRIKNNFFLFWCIFSKPIYLSRTNAILELILNCYINEIKFKSLNEISSDKGPWVVLNNTRGKSIEMTSFYTCPLRSQVQKSFTLRFHFVREGRADFRLRKYSGRK